MEFVLFDPVERETVRESLCILEAFEGVVGSVYAVIEIRSKVFCPLYGSTFIRGFQRTVDGSLCRGLIIRQLSVEKSERHQGKATEMIVWLVEQALELDCDFVRIESVISPEMESLATKLQFVLLPSAYGNSFDLVLHDES